MPELSRRQFIQLGAAGAAGTWLLPQLPANAAKDEHFFVHIFLQPGADSSYLFDARPLSMTAGGKIQNYSGTDPTPWMGRNGTSCLISSAMAPLLPFRDRLSVVNGIIMSTDFDGHPQNVNNVMTGNPFGGASYLPDLNLAPAAAIDTVQNGNLFGAVISNAGGTVPMDPQAMGPLGSKLNTLPSLDPQQELGRFIRQRLQSIRQGTGRFSAGSANMQAGFDQIGSLRAKLLQIASVDATLDTETQFVNFLGSVFKNQIARSALWVFSEDYDTHAARDAQKQPKLFADTSARLARIFKALSDTPFDGTRSLFDVTTVMVSSEFSRTMRQRSFTIDQTGTDHNPYGNSAIFAGKGIRGGQVIGATDYQSIDEKLSSTHLALDADVVKLMGRPFDFKTGQPRLDLPSSYQVTDYLNIASVVNTIYSMFGVDAAKRRVLDRGGTVAPVLNSLLSC